MHSLIDLTGSPAEINVAVDAFDGPAALVITSGDTMIRLAPERGACGEVEQRQFADELYAAASRLRAISRRPQLRRVS